MNVHTANQIQVASHDVWAVRPVSAHRIVLTDETPVAAADPIDDGPSGRVG